MAKMAVSFELLIYSTAALLISRHDANAMRRPFWHSHLGIEKKAASKA